MNRLLPALLAPLILAAGCAGDFERHYNRWRGYAVDDGPYSKWAQCIDERSYYRLSYGPAKAADEPDPDSPRPQLFTYVLADCRGLMAEDAWGTLQDKQVRRLLGEAWRAFSNIDAEIRARRDESII